MKIKHGLISVDSHAQLDCTAFTERMSKTKWGDRIPHLVETTDRAHMAKPVDHSVQRWLLDGRIVETRGVANCAAAMGDPTRKTYPQRWEEVPKAVYDPAARVKLLDEDGVDGEVLFPNPPIQSAMFMVNDAALEVACVEACNDALADWAKVSDRYIPLALIPYLSGIDATVREVERALKNGHRGILMVIEPSLMRKELPHFSSHAWDPLWAACQDMDVAIHWHSNGGVPTPLPRWEGFAGDVQAVAAGAVASFNTPTQFLPNLVFSGVLDRYPQIKWVWAEAGLGSLLYALDACDHEWERRRLWTEGVLTRPSEQLRRQLYGAFWFEKAGLDLRHKLGTDHIMWESDYPHTTSTYPDSRKFVERTTAGLPVDERNKILYENALKLYGLTG